MVLVHRETTVTWLLLLLSHFSRVWLCNPIDGSPPGSPHPWDSPGKNTGVGCHFLLQCMKVKSESEVAQSCLTLCDPKDDSPSGSTFPGILQARTLEWVAISFSNVWKGKVKVKSLSLRLSDPMDCSLPGFSVHGIFQARVLEWVAIALFIKCPTYLELLKQILNNQCIKAEASKELESFWSE